MEQELIKVVCKFNFNYFEKNICYYSKQQKLSSGGTYSIYYEIFTLDKKIAGEIGYLYDEIFEPIVEKRKRIIDKLLYDKI